MRLGIILSWLFRICSESLMQQKLFDYPVRCLDVG